MSDPITFFVHGLPKPAGSKRAFSIRKGGQLTGRVAVVDACKGSKDWKHDVRMVAETHSPTVLFSGAISLRLCFWMPRPKSHFGTGTKHATLKQSAPKRPIVKPDVLKLARGVEDALTKIIWVDDAQIVEETICKYYGDTFSDPTIGVSICVQEL